MKVKDLKHNLKIKYCSVKSGFQCNRFCGVKWKNSVDTERREEDAIGRNYVPVVE